MPRLQDELRMAARPPVEPAVPLAARAESVLEPLQAQQVSLRLARSEARELEPWAPLLARQAPQPALSSPEQQVQQASPHAREALLG